jgi:hypothetical protein
MACLEDGLPFNLKLPNEVAIHTFFGKVARAILEALARFPRWW